MHCKERGIRVSWDSSDANSTASEETATTGEVMDRSADIQKLPVETKTKQVVESTESPYNDDTSPIFNNTIDDELQIPHAVCEDLHFAHQLALDQYFAWESSFPSRFENKTHVYIGWARSILSITLSIESKASSFWIKRPYSNARYRLWISQLMRLSNYALIKQLQHITVLAVWTRQRLDGTSYFHSTGLPEKRQ